MSKKPKKPAARKHVDVKNVVDIPKLEWHEKTVTIGELRPYEQNPRRISKDDFDKLVKHLEEDGYHQRIVVTHDLLVIGGHQRIRALKKLKRKIIPVLVPSRPLTVDEFERILIRDNLPYGEFDMDILGNTFERDRLVEIGMPEQWLPGSPSFDAAGEDDQGKLDETEENDALEPQLIVCPKCKHEFSILTHRNDDEEED